MVAPPKKRVFVVAHQKIRGNIACDDKSLQQTPTREIITIRMYNRKE